MRKRLISPSPQAGTLHDEGWLDLDREAVWTGGPQKQSGYSHAGVCCMPLEVPSAVRLCCCSSTLSSPVKNGAIFAGISRSQ
jgi:hypothetical protein